ncbi:MAG: hypothetical protein AAGC96_01145 [Pseudomonadota bacterium]
MQNSSGKHSSGYSTRNRFSKQSSPKSHINASTGHSLIHGRLAGDDVIDAEFEEIEVVPRQIPARQPAPRVSVDPVAVRAPDFDDLLSDGADRLDLFAARKSPEPLGFRLSSIGFVAVVGVLSLCAFWFAGGYSLAPNLFATDQGPGLTLSNVSVDPMRASGQSYYVLHGEITNRSTDEHDVPLLAIGAGAASDESLPLFANSGKMKLAAGESTRFRVRVPDTVRDYNQLTVTLAGGGTAR